MTKNNFLKMNYLTTYDIICKYLIEDLHLVPKVKKSTVNISLKSFASSIDFNDFSEKRDLNIKYRAFIIFFLLNSNIPFLKNVKMNTNLKDNKLSNLEDFFFSIIYSGKNSLNYFLFSLFIENNDNFKKTNITDNIKSSVVRKHTHKIVLKIPLMLIYDFSYLINSNIFSVDLKDTYIDVNFYIENKLYYNRRNFYKNLPFFWFY